GASQRGRSDEVARGRAACGVETDREHELAHRGANILVVIDNEYEWSFFRLGEVISHHGISLAWTCDGPARRAAIRRSNQSRVSAPNSLGALRASRPPILAKVSLASASRIAFSALSMTAWIEQTPRVAHSGAAPWKSGHRVRISWHSKSGLRPSIASMISSTLIVSGDRARR